MPDELEGELVIGNQKLRGQIHSGFERAGLVAGVYGERRDQRAIEADVELADAGKQARGEMVAELHRSRLYNVVPGDGEIDRVGGIDAVEGDGSGHARVGQGEDTVEFCRGDGMGGSGYGILRDGCGDGG